MKRCSKCKEEKLNTAEHYYREAKNEDGLRVDCKKCVSKRHKKWANKKGKTYKTWLHMNDRCYNERNKSYLRYGGRGIKVHDGWKNDYDEFLKYMGERPSSEYSIDRIDNEGSYVPGNVKWSTATEQNINQRNRKDNTSGHKGVMWDKDSKSWKSVISVNNKYHYLGRYTSKEDAIKVREKAELKYHNRPNTL